MPHTKKTVSPPTAAEREQNKALVMHVYQQVENCFKTHVTGSTLAKLKQLSKRAKKLSLQTDVIAPGVEILKKDRRVWSALQDCYQNTEYARTNIPMLYTSFVTVKELTLLAVSSVLKKQIVDQKTIDNSLTRLWNLEIVISFLKSHLATAPSATGSRKATKAKTATKATKAKRQAKSKDSGRTNKTRRSRKAA